MKLDAWTYVQVVAAYLLPSAVPTPIASVLFLRNLNEGA